MELEIFFKDNNFKEQIAGITIPDDVTCQIKSSAGLNSAKYVINHENELYCAKLLSQIQEEIINRQIPCYIATDEASKYFNIALYPEFNIFERNLRKLLYIVALKSSNPTMYNCVEKIDRITLNALIGALFNDGRGIKKIKKQERPNDFVNQAIVNGINSLPKQSLWEYFIASPSYLGSHYQEIRDYRDLIMHAKNISYQKFVDMSCAIKKSNQELNILIPNFANKSIYLTTPLQKEIDKIAKKLFNLSSKN